MQRVMKSMQYRKGFGPAAVVFVVIGLFISLLSMGVLNSFVAGIGGQTAYYEDVAAIEDNLIPSAENKCSDVASESRSTVSTSTDEDIELTQINTLTFDPSNDEFNWQTDNSSGSAELSGSCDYVFENTRTGDTSIGSGKWVITITGEVENNQATVFMRADD